MKSYDKWMTVGNCQDDVEIGENDSKLEVLSLRALFTAVPQDVTALITTVPNVKKSSPSHAESWC